MKISIDLKIQTVKLFDNIQYSSFNTIYIQFPSSPLYVPSVEQRCGLAEGFMILYKKGYTLYRVYPQAVSHKNFCINLHNGIYKNILSNFDYHQYYRSICVHL